MYKKATKKIALLFSALFLCCFTLKSENIRIVGDVRYSSGETAIGVSISLKGTTVRAITDIDGNYIISGPEDGVLVFSYLGFETQEVKIDGRTLIDVVLVESISDLDEVVVVGYGVQRRISTVGSQSGIRNVQDLKQPVATLSSVLAGRISGVIGMQRTGEAGRDDNTQIWIRGVSTTTSSKPLILVDGVERSFVNIDPEDIESFQVLKDASATAVYGVRGANGVIIINTKKGTKTKPRIKVEYNYGITSFTKVPELADGITYMQMANEASINKGFAPVYSEETIRKTYTQEDPYLYPNVNWMKELFKQNGYNQKLNVNAMGGSEFAQYYVSLGYYNEGGLYEKRSDERYDGSMDFHRVNFVSNLTMQVTKTTEIDLGVNGEISDYNTPYFSAEDVFREVLVTYPTLFPVSYPDKRIPYVNNGGNVRNPYAMVYRMGSNKRNTSETRTNLTVKQNLDFVLKGLSARALVAYDFHMRNDIQRTGDNPVRFQATGRDENNELIYQRTDNRTGDSAWGYNKHQWGHRQYYLESALNYSEIFDKHRVSGMFLYNMTDYSNITAGELIHAMPFRNLGIAGRGTYSYDDRYFGEVNFGYNGAENFVPSQRYGFFPSFGVAWVPSNEAFMESVTDKLQFLKFRFSWGQAGNSTLDNRPKGENDERFVYLSTVGGGNGYYFGTNDNPRQFGGTSVGRPGVAVTWETSTKTNLGIDFNTWKNSLEIQIDLFKERRENIFLRRAAVPDYLGIVDLPYGNLGIVENRGFEVSADLIKQFGELEFMFKGNISYSENKYIENDEAQRPYPWLNAYGHALNTKKGYIADGFYTQDDIDNPEVAKPLGITVKPGDLKFRNLNPEDDNIIDANDKAYIGYPEIPRIVYGLGLTLGYKNFTFGAFFQGVAQRSISLSATSFTPFVDSSTKGNLFANVVERWNPDNPSDNALWPRLDYGLSENTENYAESTFWLRDGSYLRLKTLDLGYTVPASITKKYNLSNLRFYVLAHNVLTFTKFDMWDVELDPSRNGMAYPNLRTLSAGLSFSF